MHLFNFGITLWYHIEYHTYSAHHGSPRFTTVQTLYGIPLQRKTSSVFTKIFNQNFTFTIEKLPKV